jgi:hypothetical protein
MISPVLDQRPAGQRSAATSKIAMSSRRSRPSVAARPAGSPLDRRPGHGMSPDRRRPPLVTQGSPTSSHRGATRSPAPLALDPSRAYNALRVDRLGHPSGTLSVDALLEVRRVSDLFGGLWVQGSPEKRLGVRRRPGVW